MGDFSMKNLVRDTYLNGLQKIVNHELSETIEVVGGEAEEAMHIFDLQFKQLIQGMIESGEDGLNPEKKHIEFLLEPIDNWLCYLRYRTVFNKDNHRYKKFISKLAWQDLSIFIANSFYKKHKYLPYQILTKKDLHQEAHLALLIAKKDYMPDKGTIRAFYFSAVYNHFFKLYQEAGAEQRKSENKKYQVRYIPSYSEGFVEPEAEVFSKMDLPEHDRNTITSQRYPGNEYFEQYDEQEYKEVVRVETDDNSKHEFLVIGNQTFVVTKTEKPKGYLITEKTFTPLGYNKNQNVWRCQTEPLNEYEQISCVLCNRRKKEFYRTPYYKNLISGSVLDDKEKQLMRVKSKNEEYQPVLSSGYSFRSTRIMENEYVGGITFNSRRRMYLKQNLPDDAYRGGDLKFYNGQNPKTIPIDNYKQTVYPYEQKYEIRELMKRAKRHLGLDVPSTSFKQIEQALWGTIESFPHNQRRLFELYFGKEGVISSSKKLKKRLCNSFDVTVYSEEQTIYKYTLKDISLKLGIRNSSIKPLRDDGIKELTNQLIRHCGVNVIRDTTDKRFDGVSYTFKTNFDVEHKHKTEFKSTFKKWADKTVESLGRELFQNQSVILYMKGGDMKKLRYVNRDHRNEPHNGKTFNLLGHEGVCLIRSKGGRTNQLIKFDNGELIVCPYGNMQNAEGKGEYKIKAITKLDSWEEKHGE